MLGNRRNGELYHSAGPLHCWHGSHESIKNSVCLAQFSRGTAESLPDYYAKPKLYRRMTLRNVSRLPRAHDERRRSTRLERTMQIMESQQWTESRAVIKPILSCQRLCEHVREITWVVTVIASLLPVRMPISPPGRNFVIANMPLSTP